MPKKITVPPQDLWDRVREEFIYTKEVSFVIEHSLVSISKWEAKWHKPFLSKDEKTNEELRDYIRCMTLTQNIDPEVYKYLPNESLSEIKAYIDDPMTATTFSKREGQGASRQIVTSELIYYWMIALQIPMECQKWHLNRLLALIQVCNDKNNPGKKMSAGEMARRNSALNAMRRKSLGSRG